MRIGKQDQALTAIATSDDRSITVRGEDLCSQLIGGIGFSDYFWLLVTGVRPTATQTAALDACLVAIAEHGLVPSVQASRMTLAAGPEAFQGAVAAGLLGMGSVVAGSSEVAGRFIVDVLARSRETGSSLQEAVVESLNDLKARKEKVPGLGHPELSNGDPRANKLLTLAGELGVEGDHIACLRAIAEAAPGIMERPLPINVSGAIPALMLDAGWPLGALKGVPILARTAGLVAHLYEESERPIGFVMAHHADEGICYDGDKGSR